MAEDEMDGAGRHAVSGDLLVRGRYRTRRAQGAADLRRAQCLRYLAFVANRPGASALAEGLDEDSFDVDCDHVLVEDITNGDLVGCFRLLWLRDGSEIGQSYSAQFYALHALAGFPGKMLEMGRFCLHPDHRDPDIVRIAWATMTRLVDGEGIAMLFGCSSFDGTDAAPYADALALLAARHLAPPCWRPGAKAPSVVPFARDLADHRPDARLAQLRMPPLLRSYLLLGGWVSDHAVIDPLLNTLHVFTGLEIAAIPENRKRLFRAEAAF
jgi:L-ornithine Nalpha-acyltransferase